MPYAQLLDQLVKNSGLTGKEIAERCQKNGVNITPSYLSMLRNKKNERIPSSEVSSALAKAMGADENLLVLEGVMDTAPKVLCDAIINVSASAIIAVLSNVQAPLTEEQRDALYKQLRSQPMAELIMPLAQPIDLEQLNQSAVSSTVFEDHIVINTMDFPVIDDSMHPTIAKGSKVKLAVQKEYRNGDIIGFTYMQKQEAMQFRQVQRDGEKVMLIAFNPAYSMIPFDGSQMLIMGKAVAVTTIL